eukprot:TRINITY_DN35643_c0_g1_i1.p1 TRINITY_DN35643_c0_g1~~TRINITY_DN35643_c0_g1_i1.p1  ORF type:complete len:328 (+),score=24.03 TRINITY_DN35643_c0_g1_i1:82-1065(+)
MTPKKLLSLLILGVVVIWFTAGGYQYNSLRDELVFVSLGDWGGGGDAQQAVAAGLAAVVERENVDFIISLGDNFYDAGVGSLGDEKFKTVYEDVYNAASLKAVPWYLILGDHDHRGSVDSQIQYSRTSNRWHLQAPYYTMQKGNNPRVGFIMIDSVGLEAGVMTDEDTRRFADDLDEKYTSKSAAVKQMKWIEEQLATMPNSGVDWTLVIGHRPVVTHGIRPRSSAENKTAAYLRSIFEKSPVQIYLNGHDHTQQHIKQAGMNYITNGGGGYESLHDVESHPSAVFSDSFLGFCLHKVTKSTFTTHFINWKGQVVKTTIVNNNNKSV